MKFETTSIKEKWLNIYNDFICDSSPLQINIPYMKFKRLNDFKRNIENNSINIGINEYIKSFEDAMMEIWMLLENLYVHFQISDGYEFIIKSQFSKLAKFNQKSIDISESKIDSLDNTGYIANGGADE